MNEIVFFLGVFGVTAMLSSFAEDVRFLNRRPFTCPLCMGFWYGVMLAPVCFGDLDFGKWMMAASASAGFNWIFFKYVTGDY